MTELSACERARAAYAPTRGNVHEEGNAPVVKIQRRTGQLPVVWVSVPEGEPTLEVTGRTMVGRYPDVLGIFGPDEYGVEATNLGARYAGQGLDIQDPRFLPDRIDCFRAAEALSLWGASHGDAQALCNLGYFYAYDRCQGGYLGQDEFGREVPREPDGSFPCDRRAYECYLRSAQAGHPNACYKVGDLLAAGRGCQKDLAAAVSQWEEGYELGRRYREPVWWGAPALRLGRAYEEGEGCEHDFSEALRWYKRSVDGLSEAVQAGEWLYRKSLRDARNGVIRCEQELDGGY